MRGLKTPEEVSTRMVAPFMDTAETRRAGEELARWQSGQAGCAAASATRSTGGDDGDGPAAAWGTEDPEGAFTSVDPCSASPGPLKVAATRGVAGPGRGGRALAGGARECVGHHVGRPCDMADARGELGDKGKMALLASRNGV